MKTAAVAVLAFATVALASQANAQTYPAKPIRIVVPFAPAGPTDNQARWAAQQLNAAFGPSSPTTGLAPAACPARSSP